MEKEKQKKELTKEKKRKIGILKKEYSDLIKKYPTSKKQIDDMIEVWCNYYSKFDNEKLEELFDEGTKKLYIQKIKDYINLVNEEWKPKKSKESKPKLTPEQARKDIKKVYKEIIEILKYYMDMKEEDYVVVAIWIIGSWFQKKFETYPYLYFNAMRGSGKTRILKLISNLTRNGELINSVTDSVLFRTASTSTFCIDEFERLIDKDKASLIELLNNAYKKGGIVKRMMKKEKSYEVEKFDVYCPVVIANIWGMDNVLEDRCIPLILEKSNNPKITRKVENFTKNTKIQEITSLMEALSDVSDVLYQNIDEVFKEWNIYVELDVTNGSNVTNVTNVTNVELFKSIQKANLDGRDLELFYPLYFIADSCNILNKFINISQTIIKTKKEKDITENKDIQLFDFCSSFKEDGFVSVTNFTNGFREFLNLKELEEKWINSRWMGRALRRLALIRDSRRMGNSRQILIDIEKAKEKIKMFRDPIKEIKQDKITTQKIK